MAMWVVDVVDGVERRHRERRDGTRRAQRPRRRSAPGRAAAARSRRGRASGRRGCRSPPPRPSALPPGSLALRPSPVSRRPAARRVSLRLLSRSSQAQRPWYAARVYRHDSSGCWGEVRLEDPRTRLLGRVRPALRRGFFMSARVARVARHMTLARASIVVFVLVALLTTGFMIKMTQGEAAPPVDIPGVPHYFGPWPNWALSPLTTANAPVTISRHRHRRDGDGDGGRQRRHHRHQRHQPRPAGTRRRRP